MPERRIAFIAPGTDLLAGHDGLPALPEQAYIEELSRHLASLGHSVDVFTRWESWEAPDEFAWGPHVWVLPIRTGPPRPLSGNDARKYMPAFRDAVLRRIHDRAARYDLIHANTWLAGWTARELSCRLNFPFVQTVHTHGSVTETDGVERDVVVQWASQIIVHSPTHRTAIVGALDNEISPVEVIPWGVDTRHFRPIDRLEARHVLGLSPHAQLVACRWQPESALDMRTILNGLAMLRDGG